MDAFNYKQKSFAPLLKRYNNGEDAGEPPYGHVEIYGLKHLIYDSHFRHYRAIDKMHSHSIWEIHIYQTGHQLYRIRDEEVDVNAGEFILIAPGVEHSQVFAEEVFSKFSLVLGLPGELELTGSRAAEIFHGFYKLKTPPGMIEILEYLFANVDVSSPESLRAMHCCMELFLLQLHADLAMRFGDKRRVDHSPAPIGTSRNEADFCEQVVQYVHNNLSQMLTIGEIADRFSISPRHLSRKIQSYYGKPLGHIIGDLRCNYAKDLLGYTDLTVDEIAERVGFTYPNHFVRFFRRKEGQTPTNYRNSFNEVNYGKV